MSDRSRSTNVSPCSTPRNVPSSSMGSSCSARRTSSCTRGDRRAGRRRQVHGQGANMNVATLLAADRSLVVVGQRAPPGVRHRPYSQRRRARIHRSARCSRRGRMAATISRLAGLDVHLVHSRLYYVQVQGVQSWTDSAGRSLRGSLVEGVWDRTGRASGFHYTLRATAPGFPRGRRVRQPHGHRRSVRDTIASPSTGRRARSCRPGARSCPSDRIRDYNRPRDESIEGSESLSPSATLRGGWRLNGGLSRELRLL